MEINQDCLHSRHTVPLKEIKDGTIFEKEGCRLQLYLKTDIGGYYDFKVVRLSNGLTETLGENIKVIPRYDLEVRKKYSDAECVHEKQKQE